jgi:hypothetical protein
MSLFLVAGQAAAADGFRGEISGGYVSGSSGIGESGYRIPDPGEPGEQGEPGEPGEPGTPSPGASDDYDGWMLGGRIYVDGVDGSRGPLRLAPYLDRASHVGASYQSIESDAGVETDVWRVDTRMVWNDWVAEAEFGQSDSDFEDISSDADLWRVAVGYYLARDTQLRGSYEAVDGDDDVESARYAVDVTHVRSLSNGMTWSVNALAALVDQDTALSSDDGSDIEITIDWFFNDKLGVGSQILFSDRDESGDGTRWEIYGDYWLTEKVSLRLSYYDQDFDSAALGGDLEADAWTFEVLYRR